MPKLSMKKTKSKKLLRGRTKRTKSKKSLRRESKKVKSKKVLRGGVTLNHEQKKKMLLLEVLLKNRNYEAAENVIDEIIGDVILRVYMNQKSIDKSPLYYVCEVEPEDENIDILKRLALKLIDGGTANVNTNYEYGRLSSPLHVVCKNGNIELVKILLDRGAFLEVGSLSKPLHEACEHGNPDIVKELLNKSADINSTNWLGYTPLHIACKKGHLKVVELLLKKNCKPDVKTETEFVDSGLTPLYLACQNGHIEIVKLLLPHGTEKNVNVDNESGSVRPLAVACENGHLAVVIYLLEEGADINLQDNNFKHTPLHAVCLGRCKLPRLSTHGQTYLAILKHLKGKDGIEVNKINIDGDTPLHIIARSKVRDFAMALLAEPRRARIDIQNNDAHTPADFWPELRRMLPQQTPSQDQ